MIWSEEGYKSKEKWKGHVECPSCLPWSNHIHESQCHTPHIYSMKPDAYASLNAPPANMPLIAVFCSSRDSLLLEGREALGDGLAVLVLGVLREAVRDRRVSIGIFMSCHL